MNIQNISYTDIDITEGFWKQKQDLNRKTTIWNVYKRFKETGRFEAFKQNWKEGEPNKPHIFWDSDVAKWMESVAYLTLKQREPELEAIVDEVVDDIEKNQWEDGYYNSYYQLIEPYARFTQVRNHELYCLGHLIEAAVAYDKATGKNKLLKLMEKYVAFVYKVFVKEKSSAFEAPGHQEIELALVRLYEHTGNRMYLDLSLHFINERHKVGGLYHQAHLPVREQSEAVGHAVRACYMYCAMADLALRTNDKELTAACDKLFDNIVNKRMYITGAIGTTHKGEAFEEDYHLPNDIAYAETCAAISLALFAKRMQLLHPERSVYADTIERIIYNGYLSGVSLDGKAFFYVNSQEIDLKEREFAAQGRIIYKDIDDRKFYITERVEVFSCSCCPPNVTRFVPLMGEFCYTYTDDVIYVNQYMQSDAKIGDITISQKTNYPFNGSVSLTVSGGSKKLALRKPYWCKKMLINGVEAVADNGFVYVDAKDSDVINIEMPFEVRYMRANSHVRADRGCVALSYGPFFYCMEGVDNGGYLGDIALVGNDVEFGFDDTLSLPTITHSAIREKTDALYSDELEKEPIKAKFIPYFAYANRGESDMRLWVLYK